MYKFCILRNHGVKFGENRITFKNSPNINFLLEIHVYAYKWLKNVGIVMKFGTNVYFVNLNHIAEFCYTRSIIVPGFKKGPLRNMFRHYNWLKNFITL